MVKYLRIAILVAVFPTSLLAQRAKPVAILSPPDTVYFDQDWDRTEMPEDRKFVRVARHTPEGKPSGTVRDYFFPSWKKQFEGKLLSESPDVPQGLCTGWYEDGTVQAGLVLPEPAPIAAAQAKGKKAAKSSGAAALPDNGADALNSWPQDLAQQMQAPRTAITVAEMPLTAAQVAQRFRGAGPARVQPLLDTLAALGLVRHLVEENAYAA